MTTFHIESRRIVDATPEQAWTVLSNAGGYADVVDTLTSTSIVEGVGEGMRRHCVDTKGREWFETCTAWSPGQSFSMDVDIDTYPKAFRAIFKSVRGTWTVEHGPEGTVIVMAFDGETKLGPVGKAAVSAMGRDAVLGSIMDGYERQIAERVADQVR